MNKPNEPDKPNNPDNLQDKVWQKLQEIVNKENGDDYIYRGEPERYPNVSSSLYRAFEKATDGVEIEAFNIDIAQKEMLVEAKKYTHKIDEFEILLEIQHLGGETNLIDFTTDYHIALFFACDGSSDKIGRVILLNKATESISIKKPQNPVNRIISQKSVFVQPCDGYIEPDIEIEIPYDLKQPILNHLQKFHGISTETIYNDLQGFIRHQDIHNIAYTMFYKGFISLDREEYQNAIKYYSKAIAFNPNLPEAYNNRGLAYCKADNMCEAIKDFNMAIKLHPPSADFYGNRGLAWLSLGKWVEAMSDLTKAGKMGTNIDVFFHERLVSIENFEQKFGVKLPEYIAILLTQSLTTVHPEYT